MPAVQAEPARTLWVIHTRQGQAAIRCIEHLLRARLAIFKKAPGSPKVIFGTIISDCGQVCVPVKEELYFTFPPPAA